VKKVLIVLVPFVLSILLGILVLPADEIKSKRQEVLSTKTGIKTENPVPSLTMPVPASLSLDLLNLQPATLIKVIDGDTIVASINGESETIRIIGINTPETVDPRTSVECFGVEASNKAKEYFKSKDNEVWLEQDSTQGERDRYQRLLRYVFTDNGSEDYGMEMIESGYAYEYTYGVLYKYQVDYKKAQEEARINKIGLWADDACSVKASGQVSNSNSQRSTSPRSIEGDRDCSDFKTQKEAQEFFYSAGGPGDDPHKLDADRDGKACESLPIDSKDR